MRLRSLLLLILLLAVLLPLTSIFHSAYVVQGGQVGLGNSVVVVAKESNIYARIQIEIQPLENNTNVLVQGGAILPAKFTFPNGTTITITKPTTVTIILANSAVFGGLVQATGMGFDISPDDPISVQVVSGQNATSVLGQGVPGVDIFQYTLSGDYDLLTVQALGVSL